MSTVEELEQQLAQAKQQELRREWEDYLTKSKDFLETLVGKTILSWYSNGGFVLYQMTGFEEKYYLDVEGANGQFRPSRWFELKRTSMLLGSVADDRGNWYSGGIDDNTGRGYHFIKDIKKAPNNGTRVVSKIKFHDNYSATEVLDVMKFGWVEYKNNVLSPDFNNAVNQFGLFSFIVPNEVYNEAKAIYDQMVQSTVSFWEKYSEVIKQSPRLIQP